MKPSPTMKTPHYKKNTTSVRLPIHFSNHPTIKTFVDDPGPH